MNTKLKYRPSIRRGLTLIELAAVVASVALLTAVTLPIMGKARKQADAMLCKANFKQLGTIVNLYAGDNDGKMVSSSRYTRRWYNNLSPYIVKTGSSYNIPPFYCPVEWRKYKSGQYGYPQTPLMYNCNFFFMCRIEDNGTYNDTSDDYVSQNFSYVWFSKIRKVKDPSTLPIFWDSDGALDNGTSNGYPHTSTYKFGWDKYGSVRSPKSYQLGPSINHSSGFNYLFIDMHAANSGNWPYNIGGYGPVSHSIISWEKPGPPDDYLTYFHPLRKIYVNGSSGAKTIGDGFPGDFPIR